MIEQNNQLVTCCAACSNCSCEYIPKFGERKTQILTGLIATIDRKYDITEIEKLLENNVTLIHIQLAFGTINELNQLILKLTTAVENYKLKLKFNIPIGIIFEIRGRIVRTGRLRNDKTIQLKEKETIILTSNTDYKECSMKEIIYLSNFDLYIPLLKIGDFIFIDGNSVQLTIIKILNKNVTCCILRENKLSSYKEVILPYYIPAGNIPNINEIEDVEFSLKNNANFIVIPSVTNANDYQLIRNIIPEERQNNIMLLANIATGIQEKSSLNKKIINIFDGIWLNKLTKEGERLMGLKEDIKKIIDYSRNLAKPIALYLPEIDTHFGEIEDQEYLLSEPDCIIVKKMLKTTKQLLENKMEQKKFKRCNHPIPMATVVIPKYAIAKCTAQSADLLNSKAIIAITETGDSVIKISQQRPNCSILAVVKCSDLAKKLHIWKNVKPIVCEETEKERNLSWKDVVKERLNFGVKYGKENDWIKTGDLVIFCFNSKPKSDLTDSYQASYIEIENIHFN